MSIHPQQQVNVMDDGCDLICILNVTDLGNLHDGTATTLYIQATKESIVGQYTQSKRSSPMFTSNFNSAMTPVPWPPSSRPTGQ